MQFCSRHMKGVLFLVKISILKGKGLNLWTEPPCTKLYSVGHPPEQVPEHIVLLLL